MTKFDETTWRPGAIEVACLKLEAQARRTIPATLKILARLWLNDAGWLTEDMANMRALLALIPVSALDAKAACLGARYLRMKNR